jgi:hypothetical protein
MTKTTIGKAHLRPMRIMALLFVAFGVSIFPSASADSPSDPKRVAFEAVDRNAEAIATVGDVLYYFGEPGMQEYESSKYLKQTLEQIGFNVELGGAGLPTNRLGKMGIGKTGDHDSHRIVAIARLPSAACSPTLFLTSVRSAGLSVTPTDHGQRRILTNW